GGSGAGARSRSRAWTVRHAGGTGFRAWYGCCDPGTRVRTIFYHETDGEGHGTWLSDGVRNCEAEWWKYPGGERSWMRDGVPDLFTSGRGYDRQAARAGRGATPRRRNGDGSDCGGRT